MINLLHQKSIINISDISFRRNLLDITKSHLDDTVLLHYLVLPTKLFLNDQDYIYFSYSLKETKFI